MLFAVAVSAAAAFQAPPALTRVCASPRSLTAPVYATRARFPASALLKPLGLMISCRRAVQRPRRSAAAAWSSQGAPQGRSTGAVDEG